MFLNHPKKKHFISGMVSFLFKYFQNQLGTN
uniref:Urfa' product n=1 Tax=Schizosaccharomyces pombe TaxID=4896 RepID=Q35904_SCHPM|nr:urfa' product [Schizosaccharomyces pombe]